MAATTVAGAAFLSGADAAPKPIGKAGKAASLNSFLDLHRPPDVVWVFTEDGNQTLRCAPGGRWMGTDIEVAAAAQADRLAVTLAVPKSAVKRLHLRWPGRMDACRLVLGDT